MTDYLKPQEAIEDFAEELLRRQNFLAFVPQEYIKREVKKLIPQIEKQIKFLYEHPTVLVNNFWDAVMNPSPSIVQKITETYDTARHNRIGLSQVKYPERKEEYVKLFSDLYGKLLQDSPLVTISEEDAYLFENGVGHFTTFQRQVVKARNGEPPILFDYDAKGIETLLKILGHEEYACQVKSGPCPTLEGFTIKPLPLIVVHTSQSPNPSGAALSAGLLSYDKLFKFEGKSILIEENGEFNTHAPSKLTWLMWKCLEDITKVAEGKIANKIRVWQENDDPFDDPLDYLAMINERVLRA
jgi:hypothetical protein